MLDFLKVYKKDTELNNFYISIFIRILGISLISIFIPIYLYQIGYNIDILLNKINKLCTSFVYMWKNNS